MNVKKDNTTHNLYIDALTVLRDKKFDDHRYGAFIEEFNVIPLDHQKHVCKMVLGKPFDCKELATYTNTKYNTELPDTIIIGSGNSSVNDEIANIGEKTNSIKCPINCDVFGYEILQLFDKKYKADKIFDRSRDKVLQLQRGGNTTVDGKNKLLQVIELYEEMYNKFILQVENDRTFTPKASSGGKPIKLVSSKEWAV